MSESTALRQTPSGSAGPGAGAGAVAGPGAGPGSGAGTGELLVVLRPLLLDVALPLGTYYLLHDGLGAGLVTSLAVSSVPPAVRALVAMVSERRVNALALLMLVVNVVGIGLSFVTGDPRIIVAKDSGVSSVIGLVILLSAFGAKPLMSAGLKPMLTRGAAAKVAAWDRLSAGSRRFRGLERLFSVIWGTALLSDCVLRLAGAFTLPVTTMAWLGTVLTLCGIAAAILVGGIATRPMELMVNAEAENASAAAGTELAEA